MIELLLLGGLVAVGMLIVVVVLFVLHQRRQGTVRAVFMPRLDAMARRDAANVTDEKTPE